MASMRSTSRLVALTALATALGLAGPASADKLLFSGVHGIRFAQNGAIKEVVAAGGPGVGVAIVNGSSGGGGVLNTLQLTRPFAEINDTAFGYESGTMGTSPNLGIDEIRFEGVRINPLQLKGPNAVPGLFKPIQGTGLTQSTLPVAGTIHIFNVCNPNCAASVAVKLSKTSMGMTRTFMGFAIGPGVGGTMGPMGTTGTFTASGSGTPPTQVVVKGHPWTVKTTTASYVTKMGQIGFLTGMGFAKGPLGNPGSTLDVTVNGMGGMLQLVTATQTTCLGCSGSNTPSGQISRLTLTFAPEPGLLLLFGAGAIGVALLGRKRTQR